MPVTIQYSPANFLEGNRSLALADGTQVLPLAGVADLPTIMCREGPRPFAEYVADEHGFNNPKGLWQKPVELVFIGNSMTYGACLPERDHFIGQIRARHPATLNLSNGGIGPLFYLAIAREFLPCGAAEVRLLHVRREQRPLFRQRSGPGRPGCRIRPRHLAAIPGGRRLLTAHDRARAADRQRLETAGGGHDRCGARRPHAGQADGQGARVVADARRLADPGRSPATPLAPQRVQSAARRASAAPSVGREQTAQTAAPDHLEIFKTTFAKTLSVADAAGAKLVFVNIPAQGTLCDGVTHPWKKPVLDFVAQTGVDVIDLEKDFRNAMLQHGREQVFAVPPCGGHFSELGYRVIGDRLLQYLEIKDARKGGELADVQGWSHRRRTAINNAWPADSLSMRDRPQRAGALAARRADAERWRRQRPNVVSRAVVGAADWATARAGNEDGLPPPADLYGRRLCRQADQDRRQRGRGPRRRGDHGLFVAPEGESTTVHV